MVSYEKQIQEFDSERQELINENIKVTEESHKLVSADFSLINPGLGGPFKTLKHIILPNYCIPFAAVTAGMLI